MSTRTQIYLTDEQRRRIDELSAAEGITMAEIVRRALDGYLNDQADPEVALATTFGAVEGLMVPSRDEWDRG
jgi:predicted DNA-binding protein